jgi:2-dehydro-3-deoxygluconokinase
MTTTTVEVLAIGEPLALVDPLEGGPIEDVPGFTLKVAGAELNALIGLARLGHRTALVSAVGDDPFGRLVRRTIRAEGIDDAFVFTGSAPTGVFFKERLNSHGRRVYYYRAGSAASKVRVASARRALAELRPRFVLVSGLTLGIGKPDELGDAAVAVLEGARAMGATVVFDANLRAGIWDGEEAAQQFEALVPHVDVLLAGVNELSALRSGDPEHVAASFIADGITNVVVKYGKHGSVIHTADGSTSIAPRPVEMVDAIGAGDAYAAGLVSGLLRGWPLETAARLGSAMGAHAVSGTGDWESLPTGDVAQQLIEDSLADSRLGPR